MSKPGRYKWDFIQDYLGVDYLYKAIPTFE